MSSFILEGENGVRKRFHVGPYKNELEWKNFDHLQINHVMMRRDGMVDACWVNRDDYINVCISLPAMRSLTQTLNRGGPP
jgi:hypothetical protein